MQVSALAHSLLHLSPEQLGLRTRTEIGGEMVSGQGGANENASPQLLLTSAADDSPQSFEFRLPSIGSSPPATSPRSPVLNLDADDPIKKKIELALSRSDRIARQAPTSADTLRDIEDIARERVRIREEAQRLWDTQEKMEIESSLRKMKKRELRQMMTLGIDDFRLYAARRRHEKALRTRAVSALRMRGARLVFNSWIEMVHERAFHLARLREALFALRHAGARKALTTWLGVARERARLGAFGTALRHSGLRRAWSTWEGVSTEWRRQERLLRGALVSLLHSGLRRALNIWAEALKRLKQASDRLRGLLAQWVMPRQHAAFTRWIGIVQAMLEARQRSQRLLLSAASAFRGDVVRKAWKSWLSLLHDRRVMESAVQWSTHRLQRAALNTWTARAGPAVSDADRLLKAHLRVRVSLQLRAAWGKWRRTCLQCMHQLDCLRLALLSFRQKSGRKALITWVLQARAMAKLRAFGNALRHSGRRRAWSTWREVMELRERRLELLRRTVASL
eukprot:jgi/Chrpa1/22639/Chrysochromulina_OHIO_Genome00025379-RA